MSFKKNYPLANEPSCRTVTQESTPNQAVSLTKSDDNWQLLDEVLQGSPVATFVIDTNFKVTHWNRACEYVTGVSATNMVGSTEQWKGFYPAPRPVLADLIIAGEIEKAMARYEAGHCRRSPLIEGAYEAEGYFPHACGDGRWLYFTAAPIRNSSGEIVAAIETLQNITARKLAEQALQDQFNNLEKVVDQRTAELRQRNDELLELNEVRSQLEERVTFASTTAMTAMSSMGEMGVLLQALQNFNNCHSPQEIAESIINSLANFYMSGVAQIRTADDKIEVGSAGKASSHDSAVFARLVDMGRIVHFHSRMIINYPDVSLLIHDIPKDDDEKVGRIRDNLAILVEAANVRLTAILANVDMQRQQAIIDSTMQQLSTVLSNVEKKQHDSLAASNYAIHNMVRNLEKLFVHLGLTQTQEEELLALIDASIGEFSQAQSGQLSFQAELSEITGKLGGFLQHK
jgi:PAS domain S-box-containing protein